MRALTLFVALLAGCVSTVPVALLALGTFNAIGNFSIIGTFEVWSLGSLVVSIGCWLGYAAALLFCRRAYVTRSLKPLRSSIIAAGLVLGIVSAVILELMWSPSPKIYIPWGLFLWPIAAVVSVGALAHMWPNPSIQSGPAQAPAAD